MQNHNYKLLFQIKYFLTIVRTYISYLRLKKYSFVIRPNYGKYIADKFNDNGLTLKQIFFMQMS